MAEVPSNDESVKLFALLSESPGVRVLQFGLVGMDVAEECMYDGAVLVRKYESLIRTSTDDSLLQVVRNQIELTHQLHSTARGTAWTLDWLENEGDPGILVRLEEDGLGDVGRAALLAKKRLRSLRELDFSNDHQVKQFRASAMQPTRLHWSSLFSANGCTTGLARDGAVRSLVRQNPDEAAEIHGIFRLADQGLREHTFQGLCDSRPTGVSTLEEFRRMLRSSKHLAPEDALYPLPGHMRALARRLEHVADVALKDAVKEFDVAKDVMKKAEPLAEFATAAVTIAAAEALVPWPKRPKLGSYLATARHAAERLAGKRLTAQSVVREVWIVLGEDPSKLTGAERVARSRERSRKTATRTNRKNSGTERTPPATQHDAGENSHPAK